MRMNLCLFLIISIIPEFASAATCRLVQTPKWFQFDSQEFQIQSSVTQEGVPFHWVEVSGKTQNPESSVLMNYAKSNNEDFTFHRKVILNSEATSLDMKEVGPLGELRQEDLTIQCPEYSELPKNWFMMGSWKYWVGVATRINFFKQSETAVGGSSALDFESQSIMLAAGAERRFEHFPVSAFTRWSFDMVSTSPSRVEAYRVLHGELGVHYLKLLNTRHWTFDALIAMHSLSMFVPGSTYGFSNTLGTGLGFRTSRLLRATKKLEATFQFVLLGPNGEIAPARNQLSSFNFSFDTVHSRTLAFGGFIQASWIRLASRHPQLQRYIEFSLLSFSLGPKITF